MVNRHKRAKHFETIIANSYFSYRRLEDNIAEETALDGIYVIRTREPAARLSAADSVCSYKNLARVERVFRTLKGLDLPIRPIYHRNEERVRAHIFICLLAYYVEWHLRAAWASLLFDDEALPEMRSQHDPVGACRVVCGRAPKENQTSHWRRTAAT